MFRVGEFKRLNLITTWRFMPAGYSSSHNLHIIYNEKQNKNYSAFIFARVHDG